MSANTIPLDRPVTLTVFTPRYPQRTVVDPAMWIVRRKFMRQTTPGRRALVTLEHSSSHLRANGTVMFTATLQ